MISRQWTAQNTPLVEALIVRRPQLPQQTGHKVRQSTPNQLSRTNRSHHRAATPFRGSRTRGDINERLPYAPPENWYEPRAAHSHYRFVIQQPGKGYRFFITPDDVRARLAQLPSAFVSPLQVVQFSQMTRKKAYAPCYGMQWGTAIYLYPIEENLIERYNYPPKPAQLNEARMFGGRWEQASRNEWLLIWTEEAVRDFFLNNILIHELGHLLDQRNDRTVDRERYAEWFAIHWGYLQSRGRTGAPRRGA